MHTHTHTHTHAYREKYTNGRLSASVDRWYHLEEQSREHAPVRQACYAARANRQPRGEGRTTPI
jgi:hypothetical protein